MLRTLRRGLAVIAATLLLPTLALAQGAVQQVGPVVPGHVATWWTNGQLVDGGTGGGGGGVSSVGLSAPSSIFNVSGSPVTTTGTLGLSLIPQAPNTVFAGPSSGSSALPTFRALIAGDLPLSGVVAGSYTNTNLSVDAFGRITSAANGSGGGGGGGNVSSQLPITPTHCATFVDGNTIADSGVTCTSGTITISDGSHGTILIAPSNLLMPNSPVILNNTPGNPLLFTKGVTRTGSDAIDFDFRRIADYTGGTFGFVNATVRVYDVVSAGTKSFEWPALCVLDNSAAQADLTENSCGYFQAHKRNGGSTWALTAELQDHNADPNSPSVPIEIDLQAKGTDAHTSRVIQDLWAKTDDGNAAVVSYGLRLNTDASSLILHGIQLNGSYSDGINFAGGSFLTAPIVLADTQKICLTAFCANSLFHSAGVTYINSASGNVVSFSDAGQITGIGVNAQAGPIYLDGGGKFCMDGATCANYLSQSGGTLSLVTGASTATFSASATNLGFVNALSLQSTSGPISLASGQKICLNGVVSCTSYVWDTGGTVQIVPSSGQLNLPATTALSFLSSGQVALPTGQKLCFDSTTCANYMIQSSGAFTLVASGSGITLPATIAPSFVSNSGSISLPAGQHYCMNGTTCTYYLDLNSTTLEYHTPSGLAFQITTAGEVVAGSGFQAFSGVGVNCSGAPSGSFASVGGIVTHC